MVTFRRTDSGDHNFIGLVKLLDADLAIRDGADHSFYSQYNKIDMIRNAVVCYNDDNPIACGAFKPYNSDTVEIKRMFVLPEFRGRQLGQAILFELEKWAAELHYQYCILETGKKQPEAIKLYQNSGYHLISNYGQYIGIDNSVCMKKTIV